MNKLVEMPEILEVPEVDARLNSPLPKVQLPGDGRLLSAFAADCAEVLKNCDVYQRGGVAFIVNQQLDGLEVIPPSLLRTLVEKYLVCYRLKRSGKNQIVLSRTMISEDAQVGLQWRSFSHHVHRPGSPLSLYPAARRPSPFPLAATNNLRRTV